MCGKVNSQLQVACLHEMSTKSSNRKRKLPGESPEKKGRPIIKYYNEMDWESVRRIREEKEKTSFSNVEMSKEEELKLVNTAIETARKLDASIGRKVVEIPVPGKLFEKSLLRYKIIKCPLSFLFQMVGKNLWLNEARTAKA